MLISCERCSTTYTLDDNLIPAAGASVQCTRCGNVFLAKRAAPPKAAPATAIFGAAPTVPPAPQPAPTNRTMMFGVPGSGAPEVPKAKPSAPGGGRAPVPGGPAATLPEAPRAQAPAPVGSKTMIFGGVAGTLPEEPKARPPAPASKTMIFGGPDVPLPPEPASKPAAAPVGSRTMIFGGPAGALPEEPKARPSSPAPKPATPAGFDAPHPPEPQPRPASAPAGSRTMIFGGAVGPPPEELKAKPAAAPAGSKTMIFGGPAGALPDAPKPKAPAPKTQIFGVADVAPPPEPPRPAPASRTMVFGATTEPAGTARLHGEASARSETGRTMAFGAPGQAPVTGPGGNVIFGADDAREHPERLTESTVRVDLAEVERRARGSADLTPPGGGAQAHSLNSLDTIPPDLSPDDLPARQDRTVQVALEDVEGRPADVADPAPDVRRPAEKPRTQLFAMSDAGLPQAGEPEPARSRPPGGRERDTAPGLDPLPDLRHVPRPDPSLADTLQPEDSVRKLPKVGQTLQPVPVLEVPSGPRITDLMTSSTSPTDPNRVTPYGGIEQVPATVPVLDAVTRSGLKDESAPIDLPPEGLFEAELQPRAPGPQDEAAAFAAAGKRRNRIAATLVLLLALAAVTAVGWALFGARILGALTGTSVPPEVHEAAQAALLALKADDPAARQRTVDSLTATIQQYPHHLASRAALATALALEYDEVRARAGLQWDRYQELTAALATLEERKTPDVERQRGLLRARMDAVQASYRPLQVRAEPLGQELGEAVRKLEEAVQEGSPEPLDLTHAQRARALYLAVVGDPSAVEVAAAWRSSPVRDPLDPFGELAPAMAALHAAKPDPAAALQAAEPLRKLLEKDSTVHRAAVLLARARLASGDAAGALELLEPLVLKKKSLVLAEELLQRARELLAPAAADPGAAPDPAPPAPSPDPAPEPEPEADPRPRSDER